MKNQIQDGARVSGRLPPVCVRRGGGHAQPGAPGRVRALRPGHRHLQHGEGAEAGAMEEEEAEVGATEAVETMAVAATARGGEDVST